jgi:hypothetical protein
MLDTTLVLERHLDLSDTLTSQQYYTTLKDSEMQNGHELQLVCWATISRRSNCLTLLQQQAAMSLIDGTNRTVKLNSQHFCCTTSAVLHSHTLKASSSSFSSWCVFTSGYNTACSPSRRGGLTLCGRARTE